MAEKVIYAGTIEVGEDRKIVLQLPPDAPVGKLTFSLTQVETSPEWSAQDEAAFQAKVAAFFNDPELRYGEGLMSDEIAQAPEVGAWADRADITDSVEFVERMRRAKRIQRSNDD